MSTLSVLARVSLAYRGLGRDRLWLDPRLTAEDTRTATSASKVTDGVGVG